MDGNFIDNDFDSLIESASILPEPPQRRSGPKTPHSPQDKYDNFALRIKFNSGLDPHSVVPENTVMLEGNKKINTSIYYDKKKKSIIVRPKNKYLRNTMYILKVSGKVMSEKGRSLRSNRFIVFKQDGKTVKFYKGFSGYDRKAPDQLIVQNDFLLPAMFAFSALVLIIAYLLSLKIGFVLGTIFVIISTLFAFFDSISDTGKSNKEYQYGAKLYNQGFYGEAIGCFEHALHYDSHNPLAKAGLDAAIVKNAQGVESR